MVMFPQYDLHVFTVAPEISGIINAKLKRWWRVVKMCVAMAVMRSREACNDSLLRYVGGEGFIHM